MNEYGSTNQHPSDIQEQAPSAYKLATEYYMDGGYKIAMTNAYKELEKSFAMMGCAQKHVG